MKTFRVAMLGLAGAVMAAAAGCHKSDRTDELKKALAASAERAQLVSTATINTRMFSRTLLVSGQVRPVDDIRVTSPVANVRISKVLVDVGDRVKAGQALATIDAPLATAQIASARAQTARAKAAMIDAQVTYKNAKADLNRALEIKDTGALSEEQMDARRARADGALAKLDLAKADLQYAQAQEAESDARLQGGVIRAPRDGVVIERTANPGQPAETGTLFRIVGGSELEIAADIAEVDLNALIRGQKATFEVPGGGTVEGRLRQTPVAIADATRAAQALFSLGNNPSVKSGMFLRGEAKLPPRSYFAAPATAIVYDEGRPAVFVIDDQNRVRKKPVTLGPRDGGLIAITDGVQSGQKIAAAGVAFLLDGDLIRPGAS
ncbi:MAG: efflux RND transporter periplasmic adaptor subunit [Caulobacterales bacterium]